MPGASLALVRRSRVASGPQRCADCPVQKLAPAVWVDLAGTSAAPTAGSQASPRIRRCARLYDAARRWLCSRRRQRRQRLNRRLGRRLSREICQQPHFRCPAFRAAGNLEVWCKRAVLLTARALSAGEVAEWRRVPLGGPPQVDGCGKNVDGGKLFYRRGRCCEEHAMLLSVLIEGVPHRFCQKCCRFHSDLNFFDGTKRWAHAPAAVPAQSRPLLLGGGGLDRKLLLINIKGSCPAARRLP